jgi:lipopolysaccharide transport system permease protein
MAAPDRSVTGGRLSRRILRTAQLVRVLGPRELRLRYRQSLLDVVWAAIGPIVIMLTYGYILTRGFGATMACGPYASGAWAGLVLWTFFATSLGTGVYSLIISADLVTKVYFPREALPLSVMAAAAVELAVGLLTVFALGLAQGVTFTWMALAIVLPLAVLVVWTAALSVLAAVLASFVRDTVHLVSLVLRVGFFAVPVMYDALFLPGPLERFAMLNPIAQAIEGTRAALFCGGGVPVMALSVHLVTGIALLLAVILYTRTVESRITDVV